MVAWGGCGHRHGHGCRAFGDSHGFPSADAQRLRQLLERLGLPVSLGQHDLDQEAMIEAMGMDKKVSDGRLKFVLARAWAMCCQR